MKYRLKQNWSSPSFHIPAGRIFIKGDDNLYHPEMESSATREAVVTEDYIKNRPDWFGPIEEDPYIQAVNIIRKTGGTVTMQAEALKSRFTIIPNTDMVSFLSSFKL